MANDKGLDPEILVCLKQLIHILKEDDLSEICIEHQDMKLQVKRMSERQTIATQGLAMLATEEKAASSPIASGADDVEELEGLIVIRAPMVGTFYRAPSPESKPFVDAGEKIEADQVICVIDAMKLMNEITADVRGEIVEILVDDGQPVEYDQPIFRIKPT